MALQPSEVTITYRKQCVCEGTASGPRVVLARQSPVATPDGYVFSFYYVQLACDLCDMPWKRGA